MGNIVPPSADVPREPFSYRHDSAVPAFPDDHPIIVFDGLCGFCSGWARFVLRFDRAATFRLVAGQTALGRALYTHYGLDTDDFQTNILIENGRAAFKADACLRMLELLGAPWSWAGVLRPLPMRWLDPAYDVIARNRFRIWGKRDVCFAPAPGQKNRFLA